MNNSSCVGSPIFQAMFWMSDIYGGCQFFFYYTRKCAGNLDKNVLNKGSLSGKFAILV